MKGWLKERETVSNDRKRENERGEGEEWGALARSFWIIVRGGRVGLCDIWDFVNVGRGQNGSGPIVCASVYVCACLSFMPLKLVQCPRVLAKAAGKEAVA